LILKAKTYFGEITNTTKKIYLDNNFISCICPKCKEESIYDDRVPILVNHYDGTWYCHIFYCDHCSFESKEKMYSVNSVNEDSIDLELNKKDFKIKAYKFKAYEIKDYEERSKV
jgi:hypothetical protein